MFLFSWEPCLRLFKWKHTVVLCDLQLILNLLILYTILPNITTKLFSHGSKAGNTQLENQPVDILIVYGENQKDFQETPVFGAFW